MSQEQDPKKVVMDWRGEVTEPIDIKWARENYLNGDVSSDRAKEVIADIKAKSGKEEREAFNELTALMNELLDKINKPGVPPEEMKKAEDCFLNLLNAMKNDIPFQYGLFKERYKERKQTPSIEAPSASSSSVSINSAATVGQTFLTVITGWVPGVANLFQGDNGKVGPRLRSAITSASNLFKSLVTTKDPKSSTSESHEEIKTALESLKKMHSEIIQGFKSDKPDLALIHQFNAKLNKLQHKIVKAGLTPDELGFQNQVAHWKVDVDRVTKGFINEKLEELSRLHKTIASKPGKGSISSEIVEFNDKARSIKKLLKDPKLEMDETVKDKYSNKLHQMVTGVLTATKKDNTQSKTEKKESKLVGSMTPKPNDSVAQRTHYQPPHGGRR